MLKSESEAWNFCLIMLIIFLHNMRHLIVGHSLLPTPLTFLTHINHVHIAPILIIMLETVHPLDNFLIFPMSN
jgi:hypothetical protein